MNPNKALWEKGDFTRIAASMRESGEALVGRLAIRKGIKKMKARSLPALSRMADKLNLIPEDQQHL